MNSYPILKKWSFENDEVFKYNSKMVVENALQELSEIEEFVKKPSEKKYVFKSKWYLKAHAFGRCGYPDNSEIVTSNVVELEKGLNLDKYDVRKTLIATTSSGSKYELDTDDGINIDKSVLTKLL